MKKILVLMTALLLTVTMITGCGKDKPDTKQKGLYVGIIGFNSTLKSRTLEILNSTTKNEMEDFVNHLEMTDGTALFHAVNTALDKIESITPPEDLVNVSIVTFTDGQDQGSHMLNNSYNTEDEYLNAVSNRIKNDYVGENRIPISAYSIGIRSYGINEEKFLQSLKKLSSDPNHNVFLVDNMVQVGEKFGEIAQDLYEQNTAWEVTLKSPAPDHNAKIRFTFDQVNDADDSEQYIEGIFLNQNGTCILNNITYHGLKDCGSMITPKVDGLIVYFTFTNLYTTDGEQVYTSHTQRWDMDKNTQTWELRPEFSPEGGVIVTHETYKSAIIMMVLDCSSSLGNDFRSVKDAAIQFIETLNGNTHQGR